MNIKTIIFALLVAVLPITTYAGKCTGGHCTACKNCKYCKHCAKQGGHCSVCSHHSR